MMVVCKMQNDKWLRRALVLLITVIVFSVIGCSSKGGGSDYRGRDKDAKGGDRYGSSEGRGGATPTDLPNLDGRKRLPWEVWPYELDLRGQALRSPQLLQGDAALRQGELARALELYQSADLALLTAGEREARVVRVAGTLLGLGQTEKALEVVTVYAQSTVAGPDKLGPELGLVLAYGYGRVGNIEQAVAWFSKVYRESAGRGPRGDSANQGIGLLFRSLPDTELLVVKERFQNDDFVRGALGVEHNRRVNSPMIEGEGSGLAVSDFWSVEGAAAVSNNQRPAAEGPPVLVLLPLSGGSGEFGRRVKQGIELAQSGSKELKVDLRFVDTKGDPLVATAATRGQFEQAVTAGGKAPAAILGPLLSNTALEVASLARDFKTPNLSLTKKEQFPVGGEVFRLGATVDSQINSLVEAAVDRLALRTVALVYPSDQGSSVYAVAFKSKASARGLQVVAERSYAVSARHSAVQIAREIERLSPDAVFIPANLTEASRVWSNFSEEARRRIVLLGPASWDDLAALRRSQAIMQRAVFVSPFFRESSRPVMADFITAFNRKFGMDPDYLAAEGFDACTLILAAIRRSLSEEISVTEALSRIELYKGLTGEIAVTQSGEIWRKFEVVQFRGNARQELPALQKKAEEVVPLYSAPRSPS